MNDKPNAPILTLPFVLGRFRKSVGATVRVVFEPVFFAGLEALSEKSLFAAFVKSGFAFILPVPEVAHDGGEIVPVL